MPTNEDVTQVSAESIVAPATQTANVTQVSMEVLRPSGDRIALLQETQDSAEAAANVLIAQLMATQLSTEILLLQAPITTKVIAPAMLINVLTHKGPTAWSTYSAFPKIGNVPSGIITVKEVEMTSPVTGQTIIGVLASCADGKVYQLFAGTQDGSIVATAVTWPLPDLTQLPFELRDTIKIFREIWVEGKDLPNFEISWSTDGKELADITKVFSPPRPLQNRTQIGAEGRQIVFKFTHSLESSITPLLSYMKVDYDIQGEAAGSQGAGANY